jgi:branched-chain amino acid aminotransferase
MPRLADPRVGPLPRAETSNGCFETMRAYGGRIFRLGAHLKRLEASARYLGVRLPGDRGALARQLRRALAASQLREAVVRIAILPRAQGPAMPSIVVQPAVPPSAAAYRRGIRLVIVPTRKLPVGVIDHQAKYSARLASVLAVMDAQLRGADEALWMDAMGYVTESTASNFGVVREGAIVTPPCALGLLAGITRDVLFELGRALRCPVREMPLTRHDIYNASEAFLTSTLKEVLPVTSVDGRRIGTGRPGPVTAQLLRGFRALVRREMGG